MIAGVADRCTAILAAIQMLDAMRSELVMVEALEAAELERGEGRQGVKSSSWLNG